MEKAKQLVNATQRSAESFLQWVGRSDAPASELLDWCYYGLGRGRGSDEAHLQLVSALPIGGDAYTAKKQLAKRMAALLNTWPDLLIPYPGYQTAPDFLLYNVLSLGSYLSCPDILFEPLWRAREAVLKGSHTFPLRAAMALTKALINNQGRYHPQLMDIWLGMTQSKKDPILGGSPETGMEGIGMMPGQDDPEKPERNAIGLALLNLGHDYAGDIRNRRQRFRAQVIWLKNLWALRPEYFIELADEHKWVQRGCPWAVDALPDLFVSNYGALKDGQHCALVWRWFVACLRPWGEISVDRELCGGRVLQVHFSARASAQFDFVLKQVQGLARLEPEVSEHQATQYTNELMRRLVDELKRNRQNVEAKALEEAERAFSRTTAKLTA
jgi:hypothetical protein